MVAAELRGSADARKAQQALRSVSVEGTSKTITDDTAKAVALIARGNLAGASERYGKGPGLASVSRQQNIIEISGVLAVTAEYGTTGRHWFAWGTHVQPSRVPPRRFGSGRPKPEDGHIVGKAWRVSRERATEAGADKMLKSYRIAFDKFRVPKGGLG